MNVEVNAGRERSTDDAAGGDMDVQVMPLEMYDSGRAKVAANLHWLCVKAFGPDGVPLDLQDPFYIDQYEQEHIKPPVTRLLLSAELYCRVCDVPFQASSLQNHKCVLQVLSRKGFYVQEDDRTLVSELDLASVPVKMSAHLQLIDALMMVHTEETMSIENVMSAVKGFTETTGSMALPLDLEDAIMFWINKVIMKLRGFTQNEPKKKHFLDSPFHDKGRHCSDQLSEGSHPHMHTLDDMSDFARVGSSLLLVVHFYCRHQIRLEDVCSKEVPSIAESLSNIQLLKEFSDEFLNKCFYLKPEDMLYSPPVLKINLMQIVAEMFWVFEILKPDFVHPQDFSDKNEAKMPHTLKQIYWTSSPENAIVRSSGPQRSSKTRSNSAVLPLCHKEQKTMEHHTPEQRNRSHSLVFEHQTTNFAWSRTRHRPLSQTVPYALHFPMKDDADRIIHSNSTESLASDFRITSSKHTSTSGLPHRLSGQNLLNYICIEDEEEEIEEEELVEIINPSTLYRQSETERRDRLRSSSHARMRNTNDSFSLDRCSSKDKYYQEPLIAAIPKPAKEKSVHVNKKEESGETGSKGPFTVRSALNSGAAHRSQLQSDFRIFPNPRDANEQDSAKQADGFFLHLSGAAKDDSPLSSLGGSNSSDVEYFTDENEDELQLVETMSGSQKWDYRNEQSKFGDGESMKLGLDQKLSEWDDKDVYSGCSSPCLSSWSDSGVKMTSFAEKKLLKLGQHGGFYSINSSPRLTPDEAAVCPPWQLKKSSSSYSLGKETGSRNITPNSPDCFVTPELLELHMQLEERRHAIEGQKKKMETLSEQHRLRFGKAAFLNIVNKESGRSGTLPLPLKQKEPRAASQRQEKTQNCKDDLCLEDLKRKTEVNDGAQLMRENECSQSIEGLNEAISSIQQQIMQLSLQQDMLIKHRSVLPPKHPTSMSTTSSVTPAANLSDFVNNDESSSNQKQKKDKPCSTQDKEYEEIKCEVVESKTKQNVAFSICSDNKQQRAEVKKRRLPFASQIPVNLRNPAVENSKSENETVCSEKEAAAVEDNGSRTKTQLIEVDLSANPSKPMEESSANTETEQKNVLGFFFKDEEDKADEMAKRRAAFLVKQQRKAEEAKLRKQQQEAESELKRDETRRKAEEDRIRKEEEKARREFIKQEYLRRKQQILMEEQGLVKSLPRTRSQKTRAKSRHRGSSSVSKGATSPDLSHHGSTHSLATEAESAVSAESPCAESVCSRESFPILSRASSRNMERDWDIGSVTSSIISTEYNGPKLFKEPSSKSNKPIIINAIAHCCLAGKVNEVQKNVILEELDKCDSNHLIILFRDGSCQFRAIYAFTPDTEEIIKVTGTGPRSISLKMIDKLYKYSSDRKQFSVIPAKSVSVSVDALTIHTHLWHRRPGSARKK